MKKYCALLVLIISVMGCSVVTAEISPGIYTYTQQGDELIDGRRASITWNILVKNNNNAVVTISSWHAPFSCDGVYILSTVPDSAYTALIWSDKYNEDGDCDVNPPQFLMKKTSSGEIVIHSELFPWDSEGWYTARKIR